ARFVAVCGVKRVPQVPPRLHRIHKTLHRTVRHLRSGRFTGQRRRGQHAENGKQRRQREKQTLPSTFPLLRACSPFRVIPFLHALPPSFVTPRASMTALPPVPFRASSFKSPSAILRFCKKGSDNPVVPDGTGPLRPCRFRSGGPLASCFYCEPPARRRRHRRLAKSPWTCGSANPACMRRSPPYTAPSPTTS